MEKDEHQAVARELAIRKRLGKVFKKKREDFATEEEYNNYLEAFEDAVYCLSEGKTLLSICRERDKVNERYRNQHR